MVDTTTTKPCGPKWLGTRSYPLLIFLTLLFNFSYFYQGGGWNQTATIAEIRSLVEQKHFYIDDYAAVTRDVAEFGGHTFSNKTPSMIFFVAPVYALIHVTAKSLGVDVKSHGAQLAFTHIITILCASIWGAGLGVILYELLLALYPRLTPTRRVVLVLAMTMGTIVFSYGTIAFVHDFEAFWAMTTLLMSLRFQREKRTWQLGLASVALGCMVLASPPMLITVPAFIWMHRRHVTTVQAAIATACFGATMAPVLIYNQINFGHPLHTNRLYQLGYTSPKLLLGVFDVPDLNRLVTFFLWGKATIPPTMTHLLWGLWGAALIWRDKLFSEDVFRFMLMMFGAYLLFYLSFNGFEGGSSFGPRYMVPALLLLGLTSVPVIDRSPWLYWPAVAVAFVLQFMVVSTRPLPEGMIQSPLTTVIIPSFSRGEFQFVTDPVAILPPEAHSSKFNLGHVLGLTGFASLLPILAVNLLCASFILHASKRELVGFFSRAFSMKVPFYQDRAERE